MSYHGITPPCADSGKLFFGTTRQLKYTETRTPYQEKSRETCMSCPVRYACTREALAENDRHTIRGGFMLWVAEERRLAKQYLEDNQ